MCCCKNVWKGIVTFALTLMFSLLAVNILQKENSANKNQENVKPVKCIYSGQGNGIGSSGGGKDLNTNFEKNSSKDSHSKGEGVQIISKPRANYTDAARQNQVQGTVTLRVAFQANEQIGNISIIAGLPDGLTEQAVAAAKQIKFKPASKNGNAVTITKQVQYSFTIY